jgi:hypothetical protein
MGAEALLAAIGLAVCVVLLLRMAIGPARRARLDRTLDRTVGRAARRVRQHARSLWRQLRARGQAEREASELIERARRRRERVEREGNVYRPRSFNGGEGDDDAADGRHRRDH